MARKSAYDQVVEWAKEGIVVKKNTHQGVTYEQVKEALEKRSLREEQYSDITFALLDEGRSFFSQAPHLQFTEGASVIQIHAYVMVVLERKQTQSITLYRNHFIKHLINNKVLEPCHLSKSDRNKNAFFAPKHIELKSPNCAYRLTESFKQQLLSPEYAHIYEQKELNMREREYRWSGKEEEQYDVHGENEVTRKARLKKVVFEYYLPHFYSDHSPLDENNSAYQRYLNINDKEIPLYLFINEQKKTLLAVTIASDCPPLSHEQYTTLQNCFYDYQLNISTVYATWQSYSRAQKKYTDSYIDGSYVWVVEAANMHQKIERFSMIRDDKYFTRYLND
ncbi:hypothetical protein [Photobacterium leiognathi]|uniref:hypothetical protein n=1 Tax=Photobacterium leiognathi TaxID=553611 RepID=UPI002982AB07|nr:hypothetical protein [Photobacterium leiognathi]